MPCKSLKGILVLFEEERSYVSGADPAQNLTGCNDNPKKILIAASQREKFFRPARGVRGHAPQENFENLTSQMG